MPHQQSEPAARVRLGGGRARKSEHRLARRRRDMRLAASFSQNLTARRVVGIALVD